MFYKIRTQNNTLERDRKSISVNKETKVSIYSNPISHTNNKRLTTLNVNQAKSVQPKGPFFFFSHLSIGMTWCSLKTQKHWYSAADIARSQGRSNIQIFRVWDRTLLRTLWYVHKRPHSKYSLFLVDQSHGCYPCPRPPTATKLIDP